MIVNGVFNKGKCICILFFMVWWFYIVLVCYVILLFWGMWIIFRIRKYLVYVYWLWVNLLIFFLIMSFILIGFFLNL